MIFSTIKLVTKTATIIAAANTGYELYKKGKVIYTAYKKTKEVTTKTQQIVKDIKSVLKKK